MKGLRHVLIAITLGWSFLTPAWAQPAFNGEASEQFRSALIAFESQEYEAAYRGFMDAFQTEPVHTRTTAALLMAGKALYRMGDYAQALDLLATFHREYSSSRYLQEASQVMAYARMELGNAELLSGAVRVGVALPLTGRILRSARPYSMEFGWRLRTTMHEAAVLYNLFSVTRRIRRLWPGRR